MKLFKTVFLVAAVILVASSYGKPVGSNRDATAETESTSAKSLLELASVDFFTYYCNAELYLNGDKITALDSHNVSMRLPNGIRKGENNFIVKVISVVTNPNKDSTTTVFPMVMLRFYTSKAGKIVFLTEGLKYSPDQPQEYVGKFSF